jgi:hypothetical protein
MEERVDVETDKEDWCVRAGFVAGVLEVGVPLRGVRGKGLCPESEESCLSSAGSLPGIRGSALSRVICTSSAWDRVGVVGVGVGVSRNITSSISITLGVGTSPSILLLCILAGLFIDSCVPPLDILSLPFIPIPDFTEPAGLNVLLGGTGPVLTPLFGGEKNKSSSILIIPGVVGDKEAGLAPLLPAKGCVDGKDALGRGTGWIRLGMGR